MAENKDKKQNSSYQNTGYVLSMGVILLLLGLIVSVQTKKYINSEHSRAPSTRRLNELVVLLKETQSKKTNLEKQLARIKQQMQNLTQNTLSPSLASPQFKKLYQIAGLTSVKGEGIIIKIDDEKRDSNSMNSHYLNNSGYVHSDDILKIANELKASGAKAISINGQRLVTTSEIVMAGNNIMVNQTRITPPYIIKTIGPTDTMISALRMRGGIIEYLEVFGIKVEITKKPYIVIAPYTGPLLNK